MRSAFSSSSCRGHVRAAAAHSQAAAGGAAAAASRSRRDAAGGGAASRAAQKAPQQVALSAEAARKKQLAARKNPELFAFAQPPAPQDGSRQASVGSTGSFGGAAAGSGAAAAPGGGRSASRLPASKPEVLSPAGGWPQLRAAVENGADAVYFGVANGFNARARAANFSPEELPQVMSYLHERGVKGYVALNVLVFDEELSRLEGLVRRLAAAGVDAVIVQDVGAVALIRRVAPGLPIHGSTQMSITSAEGAEFAAGLGVTRVVVGRELSVGEIGAVSGATSAEVEAFCHGALCVSYSGQCYSSEAWGGRSANRGQCAQACRMPYGLMVDGELKDLADVSYLLSPQDLMALQQLPDMIAAGVGCFKIEGRLKGPEYVAVTTAAYRAGVDAAWEQLMLQQQQDADRVASNTAASSSNSSSSSSNSSASSSLVSPELLRDLAQVFSRGQDEAHSGLTPGFLEGSQHQRLVRGRAPRHRGLCLGRVAAVTQRGLIIDGLLQPVKRGDGLVIDAGRPEEQEQGGAVWDLFEPVGVDSQQHQQQAGGGSRGDRGRGGGRGDRAGGRGTGRAAAGDRRQVVAGEAAAGSSVELVFAPQQVRLSEVLPGELVWKSRDMALDSRLRATYDGLSSAAARKLPVQVSVSGSIGSPLVLQLTDGDGNTSSASSAPVLLAAAAKRPMTAADVADGVGQLGDNVLTPSGSIDTSGLALDQGLFLPASAFKAVRREAATQLLACRLQHSYDQGMAVRPVLPGMLEAAAAAAASGPAAHSRPQQAANSSSAAGSGGRMRHSRHRQGRAARAADQRAAAAPVLRVLCRTPAQVQAVLALPWLPEVMCDFLECHGLQEAVAAVQAAGKRAVVALPRILKPDESRLLFFYLGLGADALLLRGAGCLQQLLELGGPGAVVDASQALQGLPSSSGGSSSDGGAVAAGAGAAAGRVVIPALEGDFSLNAANVLAADLLLSAGLSRLCPTHDLNAAQLAALAEGLRGPAAAAAAGDSGDDSSSGSSPGRAWQLEAIVHQHLPIFHTEHCVFCRFLSEGNSFLDCGHPCEHHTLQLRDASGHDHTVLADMGCRNTVFNSAAQSGLHQLGRLAAAGYGAFRLELLDEPPALAVGLAEAYRAVMVGERRPGEAWEWLRGLPGGVGAGSLEVREERSAASLRPTARR